MYLATVIDLASRRVVGWAVADHLRTDLVDAALTDALVRRRPASGLVFHSDRGWQHQRRLRRRLPSPRRPPLDGPDQLVVRQRPGRGVLRHPQA
ncbi:DDE-type integrase/transposase/recombinase [Micromonospora sp. ATA51]|uniref:DDE-type integrase/transposase/recombinase n=1 Tax=Micromonospora sp. ATA51 TaxID=2806098 RepID=UPI001A4C36FD|nr:DDE-type integrase/transposase/recombinase [Micromonospora sp. ATA51]